ncbi:Ankyrin-1 [Chionoecetes opilio]|uniref:Ankyrin-1 n=1 Tax=Chionoecetes opilio TaxID=41210 RepID=A0A8J5CXB6_CHIOP|nr:Ankyrin-1 [Chionoecetes opilio]
MSRTGGSLPMTGLRRRTKYHAVTMPSTTPATTTPSSFWERMQCCVFGETGDTQLIQATKDDKYEDCKGILERDETIINAQDEATKQTALHYAAKEGKLEYVELFLEYKANCNAQDSSGNTPLHLAIENGHLDCSKKIMECNNLQINLTNEAQDSPLHLAAKKGHMQIVDMLLDTRADYNAPDSLGNTLIHLAAAGSHLNTFGKLHQLNADEINAINNHGNTPLHLAAQEGNSDIIDLLHNYNANCNLKNHLGDTALHLAVTGGHFNCFTKIMEFNNLEIDLSNNDCSTSLHCAAKAGFSEMLGHLLDQGADCNAQDKSGDTSLHLAVTKGHLQCCEKLLLCSSLRVNEKNKAKLSPLHTAAKLGQRNACDLILQHSGADIDIKNKANKTPLHFAAHKNYHEVIELLLDKGANWKLRDKRTYMPLHYAAEKGFENSCEHLMKAFKKDKNSKTLKLNLKDMKTPLMLAAKGGHHRCCKKLPLHDINKQDNYENTALFYAVEGDYQKTVSFLLEKSADTTIKSKAGRTVLHQAAKNKADECLSYLLNKQNTRDLLSAKVEKSGFTPLHEAINSEALTCAKMLLEHNASFTETCKGGMTPLHLAAKQGDPGICSLLMSYDETAVNKENERQETPLHMAAMHGCKDACKVLIQRGTHVLAKDKDGRTALHLAADREHEQVLTLLMRRGASPYIKDDSGATPLHLAASKGHLKCCQILVNNAKRLIQEEDEENKLSIDKAFENKHDDVFAFLIKCKKRRKEGQR